MISQLQFWRDTHGGDALNRLQDAELSIKSGGLDERVICSQCLLGLSLRAKLCRPVPALHHTQSDKNVLSSWSCEQFFRCTEPRFPFSSHSIVTLTPIAVLALPRDLGYWQIFPAELSARVIHRPFSPMPQPGGRKGLFSRSPGPMPCIPCG